MKMTEADVIWTPGTSLCRVEVKGSGWTRTAGDRWVQAASWGSLGDSAHQSDLTRLLAMFVLFNTIVVRDEVDVQAAHKAFLKIDEYRKKISPDIEGAD